MGLDLRERSSVNSSIAAAARSCLRTAVQERIPALPRLYRCPWTTARLRRWLGFSRPVPLSYGTGGCDPFATAPRQARLALAWLGQA